MVRGIGFFVFVCLLVNVIIVAYRHMNGKQRWSAVKSLSYSIVVAFIAAVIVVGIVAVF